jgi:hypothetical protein
MAKKTSDRTKKTVYLPEDMPIFNAIVQDAFDRGISNIQRLGTTDLDEMERRSEADSRLAEELCAWMDERTKARSRMEDYITAARMLFSEISEKLSAETAAWIFQLVSRRTRSKTYDPPIEKALWFHASITGSTYQTAKFAHETCQIGQSVIAVQKHVQRLMKKPGDKKSKGKSRDK